MQRWRGHGLVKGHSGSAAGARRAVLAATWLVAACTATPATVLESAESDGPAPVASAAVPAGRSPAVGGSPAAAGDRAVTSGLPRSTVFANVEFSLTAAHVSRQTPASYAAGGAPEPTDQPYAFLDLTARNRSVAVAIRMPDDVFQLDLGRGTPVEPAGGGFAQIEPDAAIDGMLAFEVPDDVDLAAAVLQIGRRPDSPALLPLSGEVPKSAFPFELDVRGTVVGPGATWGSPVTFELVGAIVSKDLVVERCCPDSGPRADEDEVFMTFSLQATGPDDRFGDSINGDAVRLIVDGLPRSAWHVPMKTSKGETVDVAAVFVVPTTTRSLELELGDSSAGDIGRIPIPLPSLPPY